MCRSLLLYRRKTLKEKPERLKYKASGYSFSTLLAIIMIVTLFAASPLYPGQVSGLTGSIALFLVLAAVYFLMKSVKIVR